MGGALVVLSLDCDVNYRNYMISAFTDFQTYTLY